MSTLILSDVHLDVSQTGKPVRDHFTRFLRGLNAGAIQRIIILGDLFDFWFEYRHVIFSGYFDVLRAFAGLRDQGVAVDFVCGNHDFWAGRFLREELGFSISRDRLLLDLYGRRVLLVHGDGLNQRDVGYRLYKRVARARCVVWLFGLLHPDAAMGLAQRVSRTSRRLTQSKDLSKGSEVEPLRAFAQRILATGEADAVVCGHSHHPEIEEFPMDNGRHGLYVNTGDWMWHRSYIEWDEDGPRLLFDRETAAGQDARSETERPE